MYFSARGKVLGSVTQINLYFLDLHIILKAIPRLPDEDSIIVFLSGEILYFSSNPVIKYLAVFSFMSSLNIKTD